MSKSIYEKYADEKQPKVLASTVTLSDAISNLKKIKETFSSDYYEAASETIAQLFNLSFEEIDRAVSGQEYWIT
jgi:hypothetical protein